MEKVNLKKASVYYTIGNLFNRGISFITVPFFTRLLNESDYGIVTTFNSWVAILSMVFGFAIYMGIRAAFIDYEAKVAEVLSVTSVFTVLSGVVLSGFIIGICTLIPIKISLTLIIMCCLQGISAALIQNYSMFLMMRYRYKERTVLMIGPNLLSALFSIAAVAWIVKEKMYLGRIVPTVMIYFVFAVGIMLLIFRQSKLLFHKEYLGYALKVSAPLVLHGVALNILSQSDLTMITWLAGARQAGIYALIYNFSMIAIVITTSLDGVWVPWFTGKLKNREVQEINEHAVDYIKLMTTALVGVMLVGPEVVKILAPLKYWEGISIIPPIVIANFFVFAYTLYVNIEHYHKKTIYITTNTIIAAVFNIIMNYIFIPRYGYCAAAYTTLASYVVAFILHTNYAKKLERELYPLKSLCPYILQIVIATIAFYVFKDRWGVRWGGVSGYFIAEVLINRERIQGYLPARIKIPFLKKSSDKSDDVDHGKKG